MDKVNKIKTNIDVYDEGNHPAFHITDYSATLKGTGSTSWDFPKKGYNINLVKKQELLGMPKHKQWCIIANYRDKTLVRNSFASWMGEELFNSFWSPSYKHVDVIMNGDYLGNYVFAETIRIDKNRVNIPDIQDVEADIAKGEQLTLDDGGFIMEVYYRLDADFNFTSTQGVPFCLKRPDETSEEINTHVQNYIQMVEDCIYSDSWLDAEKGYLQHINKASWIDWYLINEFTKNVDAPFGSSCYMYYDPSHKQLFMGPIWDFDRSYGSVTYYNVADPTRFYIKGVHPSSGANWYTRILEDPKFLQSLKERWNSKKGLVKDLIQN